MSGQGEKSPTTDRSNAVFIQRVLIAVGITLAILVAALVTWFARHLVLLVFAGILVGIFLQWAKHGTMRYTRLPALVSLGIVLIVLAILLIGLLAFLVPIVIEQSLQLLEEIPESIQKVRNYLYRYGLGDEFQEQTDQAGEMLLSGDREALMEALRNIIGIFSSTFGALFAIAVIIVIGIYIAADQGMYTRGVVALLPARLRPRTMDLLKRLGHELRWWMLGQSVSMLILGSTVTLGLTLIGIPDAVVLGVFTAIMTFIPNLGPFIAFIPIALVAFTQSFFQLMWVGVFYLVIQSLEGFFITPTIHRKVITMPPVLILATQVLLFQLAGFLGVLMAMPLVASAMVIVRMLYIEDILGEQEPDGVSIISRPLPTTGTGGIPEDQLPPPVK